MTEKKIIVECKHGRFDIRSNEIILFNGKLQCRKCLEEHYKELCESYDHDQDTLKEFNIELKKLEKENSRFDTGWNEALKLYKEQEEENNNLKSENTNLKKLCFSMTKYVQCKNNQCAIKKINDEVELLIWIELMKLNKCPCKDWRDK